MYLFAKYIKMYYDITIINLKEQDLKKKNNKKPFFRFIKCILRIFKRKPKIINLNDEELEDGAIYLTNHCAASGPLMYELYFPKLFRFWGTYEMCGNLKQRWGYLANIYFPNKKHFPKWISKIFATFATPFMHMFYKGMQVIPTYPDSRLRTTLKTSFEELDKDINLIIFPENSSDGYHAELKEYFAGFLLLAKYYYKYRGKNLKIYNMYYCKKKNKLIIDKAVYYLDLIKGNKTAKEIANDFKERVNNLYHTYCVNDEKQKQTKID